MKFRRRRSLVPRVNWREALEHTEPLRGQVWTRSERALRDPEVHWGWRVLAGGIAILEIALLGWLWFGPALRVQSMEITGARHMTAGQVTKAAGLADGVSIISVDGISGRDRLLGQVWIRAATVEPKLPGKVVIQVSEWQPVAVYHAGASTKKFWLSNQAVVLGQATNPALVVDVQGPAGNDPKVGDRAVDAQLLTALVNIQKGLPSLIGQEVSTFIFDSCGSLTLVVKRGWKVYFGRVLTPEQFASLRDKLSALKAISGNGNVDFNSNDIEYVNVMNPAEPAVAYKPKGPPPSPAANAPPPAAPTCK
jgi:cell division septal protein FtsQ